MPANHAIEYTVLKYGHGKDLLTLVLSSPGLVAGPTVA